MMEEDSQATLGEEEKEHTQSTFSTPASGVSGSPKSELKIEVDVSQSPSSLSAPQQNTPLRSMHASTEKVKDSNDSDSQLRNIATPSTEQKSSAPFALKDVAEEIESPFSRWKSWGMQKFKIAKQALSEKMGNSLPTIDRVRLFFTSGVP